MSDADENHHARPSVVVFDVGRVIVQWDMRLLFAPMFDDPDECDWFCHHVVTEAWHSQHDAGRPLAEMVAERVRAFPEYRRQIEAYRDRWLETIPGVVPGVPQLIERLAQRGVALFAITNFGAEFWARFRPTQPVLDHFADIVVSGEERMVKPGSAIFDLAAQRFGYLPQQMLFIDDSPANVASARRLGWHGHRFRDAATLEAALHTHGFL